MLCFNNFFPGLGSRERESKRLRRFVKFLFSFVFASVLFFTVHSTVNAATYYVDATNGLNTNNGTTVDTPWKTLGKVSGSTFTAGDNIFLKRGETWSTANGGGSKITVNQSGSVGGGYITYGAYGTGNDPIIDATGTNYGLDVETNKTYLKFQNIRVQNATSGQVLLLGTGIDNIQLNSMTLSGGTYGVYILSGTNSNISVTDTAISGFSTAGIEVSATLTGLTLTNATVSSGPIGLDLNGTVSSLTIASSNLSSLTSHGVKSLGSITTFNISSSHFDSNGGAGLFLQSSISGLTISDSFFNSNTSLGITIQPLTGKTVQTVNISNSEMRTNGGSGLGFGGVGSGTGVTLTNLTVSNNLANSGLIFSGIWSSITVINGTYSYNSGDGLNFLLNSSTDSLSTINITGVTSIHNGSGFEFNGTSGAGSGATLTNVTASNNSVDGINVKGNWTTVNVYGCTVETNGVNGQTGDGDGISYHNSTTGTIRNCYVSNNIKSAVAHVGNSSLSMYYNIFRHDTNGTIPLAYVDGTGTFYFYNNVIYSGAQTGTCLQSNTPTGPTVTIKNNIIYGCNKGIEKIAGTITEDYNTVYNTVIGWSGLSQGAHSVTTNPLFLNAGSADFHLTRTSPAINTGTDVGLTTDKDGTSVPQNTIQDMGAYEYVLLTVTINQAGAQSDPTSSSPINFTVVFSESVSNFATGDVTLSGTAGATTATVTGSGATYNVAVTGMTGSGTVIASIDEDKATGATSNTNNASTSTDNSVTYDISDPVISVVASTPISAGATITWITDEDSSSKVDYGLTDSYGSTTIESDTSPRVSSHTVELTGLITCTTYHYRVRSKDALLNESIGSDNFFTTTGCSSSSNSSSSTSSNLSSASTPSCDKTTPSSPPLLWGAIAKGANSILLQFGSASGTVDNYALEFGTEPGKYIWGATVIGNENTRDYLVKSLSPSTAYYFRIRAGNGCATGEWSQEISAKTWGSVSTNDLVFTDSELTPVKEEQKVTNSCQTYTVESGDSLWSIASNLLGDGNKYKEIVEQNKETYSSLSTSNNLNAGWELKVNCSEGDRQIGDETSSLNTESVEGYKVKVKVLDTDKNPVEGAKVTMHSNVQEAITDKDGIAQFSNVEPGDHRVLIAYKNFEGEQSVNLSGDVKEFALNVTVQEKPLSLSPLAYGIIGFLVLIIILLIFLKSHKK